MNPIVNLISIGYKSVEKIEYVGMLFSVHCSVLMVHAFGKIFWWNFNDIN